MQELCNFPALESAANVVLFENEQIVVQEIDTSVNGPFAIQEGCDIVCTGECRLSPENAPQVPNSPDDLTTFEGPGFISCTDGYCEAANAASCNNFEDFGGLITIDDDGKAIASDIDSAASPVEIEAGCLIECSDSCTFDGLVTISF
jgi:hypothetical protein